MSYFARLCAKFFLLTNIGAALTLIYSTIRLIHLYQNINALSRAMETFYRITLFTNVVVLLAYWGLYWIDPLLV